MVVHLEVCLETVESAVIAEANGAQRIELCGNLTEGGTTPSYAVIKLAREKVKIPIMCMIRPRGGDFVYSNDEFLTMKEDIIMAKQLRVDGVVLGILKPDGTVDVERTRALVQLAHPLKVCFHRAFDVSRDPFEALEDIISIGGVTRILTSGQDSGVLEGLDVVRELVQRAGKRMEILPGGGVTPRNLRRILAEINVPYVHMAIMKTIESPMKHRNPFVYMGVPGLPEYSTQITDGDVVAKVVQSLLGKRD